MTEFIGTVTQVAKSTTGWGDNERGVGVVVTVRILFTDEHGDYHKDTQIHLPGGMRQPLVDDRVAIGWTTAADIAAASEPTEAAFLVLPPAEEALAEDPHMSELPGGDEYLSGADIEDDTVKGDPYHDEIRQGG